MKVGFIGLGAMGLPMATNLIKAGHEVAVWSRKPGPAETLRALGARVVDSSSAAFQGDALMSMLSDDAAVRSLVIDGGLISAAAPGAMHVNLATISIALADELTAVHRDAGVAYVASPVFGRPDVAAAGRLAVVAAGDPAAVAKAQPLFDAIGHRTWVAGDRPSQANAVKICGNFMLATAIEGLSEAAALANSQGVATKALVEILTSTLFDAPVYRVYGKLISEQIFEPPGFRMTLGFKDLRLALAAAEASHVPLAFGAALRDVFLEAFAHGLEGLDWSAISQIALRRANLPRQVKPDAAASPSS